MLKSELLKFISEHGQEGFMPMRNQLRKHGRFDMEKAISRRGGFRKFASMMNLSLAYKDPKPKGYWDHLENLKDEVSPCTFYPFLGSNYIFIMTSVRILTQVFE